MVDVGLSVCTTEPRNKTRVGRDKWHYSYQSGVNGEFNDSRDNLPNDCFAKLPCGTRTGIYLLQEKI